MPVGIERKPLRENENNKLAEMLWGCTCKELEEWNLD
jgi:hypothetical protein